MHVAHVSPRYLPSQLRGGEQYVRILCEQLAKHEETTVITSNSTSLEGNVGALGKFYLKEKKATINNVKVIRFPILPLLSYGLKKIERRFKFLSQDYVKYAPLDYARVLGWGPFTPAMYSYISFSHYDFVHAIIWPTTTLYLSFRACRRAKIPFAITPFYHYRLNVFTQSIVFRRMLPFCTAIIAVTEGERKELVKIGAPPERTFVVPLALDSSNLTGDGTQFRKKHGLEGKFVVLASPWVAKGAVDVLLSLKHLSKKYSNLALVTFGEPDREYLSVLSSARPLNFAVINLGWIYGQTKNDAFAASDVLAMPSTADAFGVVYLEAWASGKPVIGAKNTAVEYIIKNGNDGFLVEMHDMQGLETKLAALIEDPERAIKMGQNGKNRVKTEFAPASMTRLFKEALAKSLEFGIPH
jgi:glycosyltransferase involved in cell wall biosynthesis